jgi:hypothetical protein
VLIGLLAIGGSGWFRAASPVVATLITETRTVISGAGAAFLRQMESEEP